MRCWKGGESREAGVVAVAVLAASLGALPAAAQITASRNGDGVLVLTGVGRPRAPSARPTRRPSPELVALIERFARMRGLEPSLVHAVIAAESSYDPRAVSKRGALGLMQLMPETAQELGVEDPFDPEANVGGGTLYLRRLLDRFGDLRLALAAYNAGPTAVARHGDVPPFDETRSYVARVLSLYDGDSNAWRGAVSGTVSAARPWRPRNAKPVRVARDANGTIVFSQ